MMTLRRKREAGEEPTEPKLVERLQDMYLVIMIIKIIIIICLIIIMMYLLIITYMSIDVRMILSTALLKGLNAMVKSNFCEISCR